MDIRELEIDGNVTTSHQFILSLELSVLAQQCGGQIESLSLITLEWGDKDIHIRDTHSGGVLIPLHGSVELSYVNGTTHPVITATSPIDPHVFIGFFLNANEHVSLTNRDTKPTRMLCLSRNTHSFFLENWITLTRADVRSLFGAEATWIHVNNMRAGCPPTEHHYHQSKHELFVPVHGIFDVRTTSMDTRIHTRQHLLADGFEHQSRGLHVPPRNAHVVYNKDHHDAVARLLVLSTGQPHTDNEPYLVVP